MNFRQKSGSAHPEKMRTHMMFSTPTEKEHRKIRRMTLKLGEEKPLKAAQQLQAVLQEKDVGVQTAPQLDPRQWTGNQRIVHFGPMAQRDPFYYYYPKGWDILYPAHFGFFPYRTKKSRGTSPIVCLVAFGTFFSAGGTAMTYLGYSKILNGVVHVETWQPLRIGGPLLLISGGLCLLIGFFWWLFSLQLCSEKLRHTQAHHVEPRKIFFKDTDGSEWISPKNINENSPYMPPPPIPVLENVHTDASLYKPIAEMKLFPPIIPGAISTLSLPRSPNVSNYNTLSTVYGGGGGRTGQADSCNSYDYEPWPEYHASRMSFGTAERSMMKRGR